ncbi:uncharacterized protein SRS1_10470 [Sporisorium reilianum f. sp. reilianum]|uniref:RNA polymerase II assembly factor Rtp1 C-terminal domain-containing protein n=1 Tax=Sporisorium reilianum f. sp. reilianum TaxID=72559 RepID=A0A2N8U8L6_9BASI|nr:uncharacterized protein SRS1_10470 [Sporisorium reilianum f. sp. reilianum]
MTETASSSDTSYRHSLHQALHASRILTGTLDDELGIQKGTKTTKLGAQHQLGNETALNATLSDRLRHAIAADDELSSFQLHSDPQVATGDLALHLLSLIHAFLIQKKQDIDSRVAVQDERLPALKRKGVQPTEDVGLGVKDVKLVTTLQSLASKWALSTRTKAYDEALFALAPKGFSPVNKSNSSDKLTSNNRFQEIDEDAEVQQRATARTAFNSARTDLFGVVKKCMSILMSHASTSATGGPLHATTDVVTVMLRVGIVDYLSSLLRLGFGPSVAQRAAATPTKDSIQKQTAAATTQLLRFLSTHSAMSALSSVIAHSDAKLGAPSFVKAVSSRLLSAQLLRPDGVRSLFIITFGGSDLAEAGELEGQTDAPGTGSAAPGTNSLKRLEHCARLLLTPPQGMPVDVYMPVILPNLLDILSPDLSASSTVTPPPQEQMRAAGFVLTRISERHAHLFSKAVHDRVYSKFSPPTKIAAPESDSTVVTAPEHLDRAISTLSSFLLFSEPSPTFFTMLFKPILPQLLTLYNYLHAPKRHAGKGKVRSLEAGGHIDRLKVEVSNFLKTWVRLVDAKHGAASLMQSIQAAERGIGSTQSGSASDQQGFFWSQEPDGISIRYGTSPTQHEQDISTLLKDLSLAALAKQISAGNTDELDLTKIAPDLSAKLGLQPDPRLLANLLKAADRRDLARLLLSSVLDVYMAQKTASRARLVEGDDGASSETRSVLYLQLILQLFDVFGSDLLQGDVPATLAFIDFSLSSPSQRSKVTLQPKDTSEADIEMPFISAKSSASKPAIPSLFNIAAETNDSAASKDENVKPVEMEGDDGVEEDEGDDDDEELVSTALSLLLSLLESDTSLSSETQPMLVVIADKIESLLDSGSGEIRSLAKEAKLVLMARRSSIRGVPPAANKNSTSTSETSAKALAYAQAQETYQEALKLLQDPILPVRAHGLVLLRRLVSDDAKHGGQHVERVDPALVPAILDIFLHAVQDEESYLYLNAVQGLAALASSGGGQTIARLVAIYVGRDDGLASHGLASREVEKRLRVGEALLQVVQRCGDAMGAHVDAVVPPLLAKLRDRALANVLRSSFVSILGTVVEAAPVAMASRGYAAQLAQVCIDIVVIEMVERRIGPLKGPVTLNVQGKRVVDPTEDDEEKHKAQAHAQRALDSATNNDAKIAHLRRAAMLLLTLLVRGTRFQLEEREGAEGGKLVEKLSALRLPGGGILPSVSAPGDGVVQAKQELGTKDLLFPPSLLERLKQVAAYVEAGDTDAIVRTHAHDCLEHADALLLDLVSSGLSLSR